MPEASSNTAAAAAVEDGVADAVAVAPTGTGALAEGAASAVGEADDGTGVLDRLRDRGAPLTPIARRAKAVPVLRSLRWRIRRDASESSERLAGADSDVPRRGRSDVPQQTRRGAPPEAPATTQQPRRETSWGCASCSRASVPHSASPPNASKSEAHSLRPSARTGARPRTGPVCVSKAARGPPAAARRQAARPRRTATAGCSERQAPRRRRAAPDAPRDGNREPQPRRPARPSRSPPRIPLYY